MTVYEQALRLYIEDWLGYEIRDYGHMISISGITHRPDITLDSGSYGDHDIPWEEMFFKLVHKENNVYGMLAEDIGLIYNEDIYGREDFYTAKQRHYYQLLHKHRMIDFGSPEELLLKLNTAGIV